MPQIFGNSLKRREDPRFITGKAVYTDDVVLPRMSYAVMVRSPHAHARITRIDATKAQAIPGVLGVFTGQDVKDAGFGTLPCAWGVPDPDTKTPPDPVIAVDTVRYIGDAVAVVVAEDG